MKKIKSFQISAENQEKLTELCKALDRSEGWIINKALEKCSYHLYLDVPPQKEEK